MTIAMMTIMMIMMMLIPDTKQLGGLRAKDLQTDLKSHRWAGDQLMVILVTLQLLFLYKVAFIQLLPIYQ